MGTQVINANVDALQDELNKARNALKGLNDNIRRISGRDPSEQVRNDRKRGFTRNDRNDRNDFNTLDGRPFNNSPPNKRRFEPKSVFNRLSMGQSRDDDTKPKLNSRIIRELPTKEEIVEAQGSDPASRARHRRMFGSLLGTLQKFCQEESRLKQKEEKKAQIEKKLEEQQVQERKNMKRERESLYNNRKRQQLEIKMLETKMNLMKEFTTWEETKKPLMNFIRTKSKPRICYLPKVMDKRTQRRLDDCKKDMEKQIEKRRTEVNEELAEHVTRFEASVESLSTQDSYENFNGRSMHDQQNRARNRNQNNGNDSNKSNNDDDDDDDDDNSDASDSQDDMALSSQVIIKTEKEDDTVPVRSNINSSTDNDARDRTSNEKDSKLSSTVATKSSNDIKPDPEEDGDSQQV